MMNNKISYIVVAILAFVVIGGGLFFFFSNKDAQKGIGVDQSTTTVSPSTVAQTLTTDEVSANKEKIVDCSRAEDPRCFINRMNECLPATVKMTGSDNKTEIELTILGIENEKCHFQKKLNNAVDLNCYFPKGTLNWSVVDQTFGNDKGLQKVVDDNCK